MKMVMPLLTVEAGKIRHTKQPGAVIEAGEVLAVMTLDDASRVRRCQPFTGALPSYEVTPPHRLTKPHRQFKVYLDKLQSILSGYHPDETSGAILKTLSTALNDLRLPSGQCGQVLSTLSGRLSASVEAALQDCLNSSKAAHAFPCEQLRQILSEHQMTLKTAEAQAFASMVQPLVNVLNEFQNGLMDHERRVFSKILNDFCDVEAYFDGVDGYALGSRESASTVEGVIAKLRGIYKNNLERVAEIVMAYTRRTSRTNLILAILDHLGPSPEVERQYGVTLQRLAGLTHRRVSKCAIRARELLLKPHMPSFDERREQLADSLSRAVCRCDDTDAEIVRELVESSYTLFDVLITFVFSPEEKIRLAAMEVYARRAYRAYVILSMCQIMSPFPIVEWTFTIDEFNGDMVPSPSEGLTDLAMAFSNVDLSAASPSKADDHSSSHSQNTGFMTAFGDLDAMTANFDGLLSRISNTGGKLNERFTNILTIALKTVPSDDENQVSDVLGAAFQPFTQRLIACDIRRVSFAIARQTDSYPGFFTFRLATQNAALVYVEDRCIRHVEPAMAFQLELTRLTNFDITPLINADNRQLHIYRAVGKTISDDRRFFIRALIRPQKLKNNVRYLPPIGESDPVTAEYLIAEGDRMLGNALDALEVAMATHGQSDGNHLFINFIPHFVNIMPKDIDMKLPEFVMRHGRRLWRLRVTVGELRIIVRPTPDAPLMPLRFFLRNESGFVLKIEGYVETRDAETGELLLKPLPFNTDPTKADVPVMAPHPLKEPIQPKRFRSHQLGTTYVYDFLELFRHNLRILWHQWSEMVKMTTGKDVAIPSKLLERQELVLGDGDEPRVVDRLPGLNTVGIVAWRCRIYTPEYPEDAGGREIILIANDITHVNGSFGPQEDLLFNQCSRMARRLGLPRIYLSANSGARIGLAEEVQAMFRIAWTDPTNPKRGFKYLYLTEKDHATLSAKAASHGGIEKCVRTTAIQDDGERRYKIDAVIGLRDGLGVENLQGSGLIAGETSRAYNDIFTITLVTCRAVGIGAYLVRLGQRTVQNEGHPIILTGASALNSVLGRDVYASNLQLGGTQIMFANGVSHKTSQNDVQGVMSILEWLSFVPKCRNAALPIQPHLVDPIDRQVTYEPPQNGYDPRWLISGRMERGGWQSGLFDRYSFIECLEGWAKTVVTGRARLGGIPVGVIAVETRSIEHAIPADPANADSREHVVVQAGQVWYPDSAYKTAQAIRDFNNGEQLPLFILANWRGFSGGTSSLYL